VVLALDGGSYDGPLRPIGRLLRPQPVLSQNLLALARWVAAYYRNPLCRVLELAVPTHLRRVEKRHRQESFFAPPNSEHFSEESFIVHLAVGDGRQRELAILELVERAGRSGGQLLVLHGEIGGAEDFFRKMSKKFPAGRFALWHGALGDRARRKIWDGLSSGEICAVSGTRSALFLPFPSLCAIAVADEENPNHRQESGIRFHGRNVALRRARIENVPCLLTASAPSLELFRAAELGRISRLDLPADFPSSRPAVTAVDLSSILPTGQLLSPTVLGRLRMALKEKRRAILLHPRKGFSRSYCFRCGALLCCEKCGTALTYMNHGDGHRCGRCDRSFSAKARCGSCGGALRRVGAGIRKVELLLARHLPGAQIFCRESESTPPGPDGRWNILLSNVPPRGTVEERDVGPVALLDGDDLFYPRNFRSGERAFQFLWRLSDRMHAGQELLIQTTRPDRAPLRHFLAGERESFCAEELAARREFAYPPHRHLALQIFSCENLSQLEDLANRWPSLLTECCASLASAEWRGPLFPKEKRRGQFCAIFWIFCHNMLRFTELLDRRREQFGPISENIREEWTVDPF
jgi:primosomal protein N' (replication factor Y)